jgi:tetratricopeptide (TPR) repeat protein
MDLRQSFCLQKSSSSSFAAAAMIVLICIVSAGCNLQSNRLNVVGRQAFEQGQYTVAINEFQKALKANPNNADAYYNLAASFGAVGKQTKNKQWLDQAEQLYRQAISVNGGHADAHRGLAGLLIETGREQYAFDLLNQWKDRYPSSTDPLVELARLYQEYGDSSRATDLLADALRLNPGDLRSLTAMGHLREVSGQTHLAIDNYLRALQVDGSQQGLVQRVAALQSRVAALPVPNGSQNPMPGQPVQYGAVNPFVR